MISQDVRCVRCDGLGCQAEASLPVALRSGAGPETSGTVPPAHDWLFSSAEGTWKHYCPRCAAKHLSSLFGGPGDAQNCEDAET